MSTAVVPTVNSIAAGNRRPAPFLGAFFVAARYRALLRIRTATDFIERRFADFAGVPYYEPDCRQLWEEVWEKEP